MEIECVDLTEEKGNKRRKRSSQGSQMSQNYSITPKSHISEPEADISIDEKASTPRPNPAKVHMQKSNLQTPDTKQDKVDQKQTELSSPQKLAQKLMESKQKSQAMSANSIADKPIQIP